MDSWTMSYCANQPFRLWRTLTFLLLSGHEFPPSSHQNLSMPSLSDPTNHCLFNLQGQEQHKLDFIRTHIPPHITLYLIGHSVGSRMIVDLLKQAPDLGPRVGGCYLLFPTLERIRNTPAADFLVPFLAYMTSVILFLSWVSCWSFKYLRFIMLFWYEVIAVSWKKSSRSATWITADIFQVMFSGPPALHVDLFPYSNPA